MSALKSPLEPILKAIETLREETVIGTAAAIRNNDADALARHTSVAMGIMRIQEVTLSVRDEALNPAAASIAPLVERPAPKAKVVETAPKDPPKPFELPANGFPYPLRNEGRFKPALEDIDTHGDIAYTMARGYRAHLLMGLSLLGGSHVAYIDVQAVMMALMTHDGMLLEADFLTTKGTTRPRALAQSSSHKNTIERQQSIRKEDDETESLTPKGQAELEAWMVATGRTLADYYLVMPEEITDRYFYPRAFAIALTLLGGLADHADVARLAEILVEHHPLLTGRLGVFGGQPISKESHLKSFQQLKLIQVKAVGIVKLTDKGITTAMEAVKDLGLELKDLRVVVPRRMRSKYAPPTKPKAAVVAPKAKKVKAAKAAVETVTEEVAITEEDGDKAA
jgi:hypothetical protein